MLQSVIRVIGVALGIWAASAAARAENGADRGAAESAYALTVWSAETGGSPGDVFAITEDRAGVSVAGHADRARAVRRVQVRAVGRCGRRSRAGPRPGPGRRARRQRVGGWQRRRLSRLGSGCPARVHRAWVRGQCHGAHRGSPGGDLGRQPARPVPLCRRAMGTPGRRRRLPRARGLQSSRRPVGPPLGRERERRVPPHRRQASSW